jgi:hypothetical protein
MVPTLRRGKPSRTLCVHTPPERFKLHSHTGAWERSTPERGNDQIGAPQRQRPWITSLQGMLSMASKGKISPNPM